MSNENKKNPIVVMKTSMGTIKLELNADKAPISVENFLKYAQNGHYNGTIFHRVIKGFMIQGGGFTEDMSQKSTLPAIKNETNNGLKNEKGTIAMARTNDINSATAQFFINTVDNSFLNYSSPSQYGYAVFGKVIDGMDVVDNIGKVKTGSAKMHQDVPVESVVIEEVTIEKS